MHLIELSNEEHYKKLDLPHNPPEASVSDKEFEVEYYSIYDRLELIVAEYGTNNAFSEGDYYLEAGIMRSRGIGFEITNDSIVTEELLHRLQHLIVNHAPSWEIHLRSGDFKYGIFVGCDQIFINRDRPAILAHLRSQIAAKD